LERQNGIITYRMHLENGTGRTPCGGKDETKAQGNARQDEETIILQADSTLALDWVLQVLCCWI
jgi:hypothetical protein